MLAEDSSDSSDYARNIVVLDGKNSIGQRAVHLVTEEGNDNLETGLVYSTVDLELTSVLCKELNVDKVVVLLDSRILSLNYFDTALSEVILGINVRYVVISHTLKETNDE